MSEDQIDDYLLGRLQGESLRAFQEQLDTDTELAKELGIRKELLQQIDDLGDQQMKARISEVHQLQLKQMKQYKLIQRSLILFFLLLLLAILGWWFLGRAPKNEILYQQHYQAYALNFGSRDQAANPGLLSAGAAYKQGDFANALTLFQNILTQAPNNTKIRLAIGLCQQELQQYDQALQSYTPLIEKDDPLYGDQARWYTALIHLHQGNREECINLLQQLANASSADFHEEAVELLGALE
ncbi:MAG: hypothetical protein DHS20C18_11960 [Saprospiraceae bacterium]|nr:MAG: hypothetical protein DHS20C18_11960 [Saprospiraceae bacterium]